ncbi:MAG: TIGR02452 family protein [Myxococcales bacterium]|nr:TIGR02452 family protein [Myxococcales bacterium]
MSLKDQALQVLAWCDAGRYPAPSGAPVDFAAAQAAAVAGTRLYRPAECAALLDHPDGAGPPPRITVTAETTQAATHRLLTEGPGAVALLNFASARNPGGGFLGGAKAQEEDLCRCSGLFPCLVTQPDYYTVNRAERSLIYTDHLIWSPAVPFFAVEAGQPLAQPFLAGVITSPAPNGAHLQRHPDDRVAFEAAFKQRIGHVLAVAQAQGHRRLVLGAWGCGAFANDPGTVAPLFRGWLLSPRFAGAFDEAVFAVYAPGRHRRNLEVFQAVLRGGAG